MKLGRTNVPASVVVGLVVAIILDTVVQIAWKRGVSGLPPGSSVSATARGALANRYFYVAMLAFSAQLVNWLRVLARADLSFAQPFTALSYITVLTLSSRFLHENLSPSKVVGVGIILLGVYFISRTSSLTTGGIGIGRSDS